MANIHSSRAKVYERRTTASDEPTQHLESEGERLIKEMVLKQTGTQISLAEQLKQKKEFEKATELVPLTKYTSGETSLKAFQHTAERASYIEELKASGLTDQDIQMVFAHEKGQDYFYTKYQKMEISVLKNKLQEIFEKIEAGKKRLEQSEEKQRGTKLSRHEEELGLAVKPESEETKLFMFAMSCQQQEAAVDLRPPQHPINQLKQLEQQMFGHLVKKKRKKTKNRAAVCTQVKPDEIEECSTSERSSRWDCRQPVALPACSSKPTAPQATRTYTCQPQTQYTIRDGKIVTVADVPRRCERQRESCGGQPFVQCDTAPSTEYEILSPEDILQQRLGVDEIKQMPRFQNYDPGVPSKVLFVKNLAKQVKETDLVSVFAHLEDSGGKRIIYRLMTGKMKGQAFVTFPSIEKATSAMGTVNGFLLHDKPMVIQYGRSTSAE